MEWGNYPYSEFEITSTTAKSTVDGMSWAETNGGYKVNVVLFTTGASSQLSAAGIYDMAGNVAEYTLEYFESQLGYPCIVRGGSFMDSVSMSVERLQWDS